MMISRMPVRCWPLTAFVLLALSGGGCVRSVQPVLKDEQVITDDSLVGRWVDKEGKETVDVEPSDKDNKTYPVVYTDKDGKTGPFVARLGKIGNLTVIEMRPQDPAPANNDIYKAHLMPLYSALIVRQTTPQLIFTAMSDDWLKKYLEAHPTELQVIHPEKDSFVVTSSTEDFQTFLMRHSEDEGAFGEPSILVRPGDATTQAAH